MKIVKKKIYVRSLFVLLLDEKTETKVQYTTEPTTKGKIMAFKKMQKHKQAYQLTSNVFEHHQYFQVDGILKCMGQRNENTDKHLNANFVTIYKTGYSNAGMNY